MRSLSATSRNAWSRTFAALHVLAVAALLLAPLSTCFHAVCSLKSDPDSLAEIVDLSRWFSLLVNTGIVSGAAMFVAVILGGSFGFLIARTNMPAAFAFALVAVLGACTPIYVSAVFIFSFIPLWQFAESALACGVIYGLIYSPLATVALIAVFRSADRDLEDQARLYAGGWKVFIHVTLPNAAWGIAIVGIVVALLVAADHSLADILIVRTFAEEVYTQYALHGGGAGPVLAAFPPVLALAALLIFIQRRFRFFGEQSPRRFDVAPHTFNLGRVRWLASFVCMAALGGSIAPLAVALAKRVGSEAKLFAAVGTLVAEVNRSFLIAGVGAAIAVVLSVGLAWTVVRKRKLRWFIFAAIVLLLGLPAPVVGIGLIDLLNRPGLIGRIYDSSLILVIGYVVRFLPLGVLLLIPAVRRVPLEHEHAARVDGCTWFEIQRHVYWPAMLKAAAVAWLIVLILSFGDVGAAVLLAPPGCSVASVRAATLIHFGVYRDLAVLALLSIAYIIIPWIFLVLLVRKRYAVQQR